MARSRKKSSMKKLIGMFVAIICILVSFFYSDDILNDVNSENVVNIQASTTIEQNNTNISIADIPEYTDKIYIEINNNVPYFKESDYTTESFERYSDLDALGRCGVAFANVSKETMPPDGDERGSISSVKPTGWEQAKYDGEYLYNRCHLIGYQLSDEDANELNLITGTRFFNVEGMLPFENKVADYIKENSNNHVLYRVTPVFDGDNLLATGVEMEAYSVEDQGQGVCFNVFVYNVQPGVMIDYATGQSSK